MHAVLVFRGTRVPVQTLFRLAGGDGVDAGARPPEEKMQFA